MTDRGFQITQHFDDEDRWTFLTDDEEDLEDIQSPDSKPELSKRVRHVGKLKDSTAMQILPLDIIYELLPFLETRDLLMFMRSCKALRERGARHLLCRSIPVRKIQIFEQFMAASDSRYRYLSHLVYSPRHLVAMDATKLLSVLSQATALQSLALLCDMDELGDMMKTKLFNAAFRIPSLHRLHLSLQGTYNLGDRALLLRLGPSLTSLRLSFATTTDPFSVLSPALLSNLETLDLEKTSFMPLETPLLKLNSLSLHDSIVRTGTLVTSFPNLRHLRISNSGRHAHLPPKEAEMKAVRSINEVGQIAHTWPSLDTLSGNLIALHNHAIAIPVTALHVDTDIVIGIHDQLLDTVLQDTQPTRLSLTLDHRTAEATSSLLEGVRALIRPAANIRHLSLKVVWRSCETSAGDVRAAKSFTDALFDMISHSPLETIRLNITKTMLFRQPQPDDGVGLGAHEIALRLAQEITGLRHILVHYQILNLERTRMRYWEVLRKGEELDMRESEPWIGEQMVGEDVASSELVAQSWL
ncbi:unnamed protein product [Peniophora sp. CBMAI 1063]|nr:unnamed protein product [Peniophora sp. CBMAI 1063]